MSSRRIGSAAVVALIALVLAACGHSGNIAVWSAPVLTGGNSTVHAGPFTLVPTPGPIGAMRIYRNARFIYDEMKALIVIAIAMLAVTAACGGSDAPSTAICNTPAMGIVQLLYPRAR